jgi:hypothetical protein
MAVPNTSEVRLEIMKAIRNLVEQDPLWKFDPNQPRIVAGNPNGGQWTSQSDSADPGDAQVRFILSAGRTPSEAECDAQYERDLEICRIVHSPICYRQAMARLAACGTGRPLPPLTF